jgi:hypothetical protein
VSSTRAPKGDSQLEVHKSTRCLEEETARSAAQQTQSVAPLLVVDCVWYTQQVNGKGERETARSAAQHTQNVAPVRVKDCVWYTQQRTGDCAKRSTAHAKRGARQSKENGRLRKAQHSTRKAWRPLKTVCGTHGRRKQETARSATQHAKSVAPVQGLCGTQRVAAAEAEPPKGKQLLLSRAAE